MIGVEQRISKEEPVKQVIEVEESKPITDEEILEANDLFKSSKEKPLDKEKGDRLAVLKEKREGEINRVFPEFSYEVIYGFKGTPEESERQYKVAKKFYESIIEMGKKPGAIKDFALRLEKLQDWDHNPKWIEKRFDILFKKKKEKLEKIIEKSKSEETSKFLVREKATKRKRLSVMYFVPEHRRYVIYFPQPVKLAEEWRRDLVNTYRDGGKRRDLGKSVGLRTGGSSGVGKIL